MKIVSKLGESIEKYWIVTVLATGVLFFWLTMLVSAGQPVWFDEGYSLLLAKSSFSELLSLTAVDAHPPLYYLLLKIWGGVFGFSEFAIRSLSAFLMSGAVVMAAVTLRQLFSTRVALTALPFLLFAPFVLRYGYEVRMYALATLIGVSATYALVRARISADWKWWAFYAVLVSLGMYALYMMAAVWLAHFVWLLVNSIKSEKRPFWRWPWLYAFAGAVVLFLPYIGTFIHQLTHSALPGMGNAMTASQLVNIVSMLSLYAPEWSLGGLGTIIIGAFIITLSVLGVRVYRTLSKKQKQGYMLLVALTVVPVAFYALTSLSPNPIFIVRYMAHSALFFAMLIGVTVALSLVTKPRLKGVRKKTYVAVLAVLCVLVVGTVTLQKTGNFVFERMQKPMTHSVREAAQCDNDDTIVIADDPYTYIDSVYYFDDCQLHFFNEDEVEYEGGYAMLHASEQRIAAAGDVSAPYVVHLGWSGREPKIDLSERYIMISQDTFDKQVVTRYQLIAE